MQNTFWACHEHRGRTTLSCSICDEEKLKVLEEELRTLKAEILRRMEHEQALYKALHTVSQERYEARCKYNRVEPYIRWTDLHAYEKGAR